MKRYPVLAPIIALALPLLVPGGAALAGSGSNPRFLTLPFPETVGMRIVDGWWRGQMDLHCGIDYIKGKVHQGSTSQSSPVIAAAPGTHHWPAATLPTSLTNASKEV